jgi:glycosyltransferase involved in cell wall biosynthesis
MESVAVNLANLFHQRCIESYVCSTRETGPLNSRISEGVRHIHLARKGIFGFRGIKRLVDFLADEEIDLVHAHGTAIFCSSLAAHFVPKVKVIWHDHFGRYAIEERGKWRYRLALSGIGAVIVVNEPLGTWARQALKIIPSKIWYVPNFVSESAVNSRPTDIPGTPGQRIVCVANLRPEKDHLTLLDAMKKVAEVEPSISLLLAGSEPYPEHTSKVKERIYQNGLDKNVFLLGSRNDVASLLRLCDIGVLSSESEGMPLALLEYGMAGLAVVTTRIGQMPEMVDEGRAGILISPKSSDELASALLRLLHSAELRRTLGDNLRQHVHRRYGEPTVIKQILGIYDSVLARKANCN